MSFDFDNWLDHGTIAERTVNRYNDLAAVAAYRDAAELLSAYQERRRRIQATQRRVEAAVADGGDMVTSDMSVTDTPTDPDEAALVADAEAAWARVEASTEVWRIRALRETEIRHLSKTHPVPPQPAGPGLKASKAAKAKYRAAFEAWSEEQADALLTLNLAYLSASVLSVTTPEGEIVAHGEVLDEDWSPAVTVDQLRRIHATPGAAAGITQLIAATNAATTENGDAPTPFWHATSGSAPG